MTGRYGSQVSAELSFVPVSVEAVFVGLVVIATLGRLDALIHGHAVSGSDVRCRRAIAPIVAEYLSAPLDKRNEMVLTKLILAALGELDVLNESAYQFVDQVRACIISSMTRDTGPAPEVEIINALRRKGFIEV